MVLVEPAVPAPVVKDATEVNASVIVDAQALNADLTDVEPPVEIVLLDKLVSLENVLELVHLNASDLMEPSELVVGTDVEVAVDLAPLVTDAETELANATPTVTTSIVEMMVVEEAVVLAKEELSAKEQLILILNNATSTVTLKSELRSESSRPTILLLRPAELMLLDL
jgi:hypothetical protein